MMFTLPSPHPGASFNCVFMLIRDNPHQEVETFKVSPALSSLLPITASLVGNNDLKNNNEIKFFWGIKKLCPSVSISHSLYIIQTNICSKLLLYVLL